MFNVYYNHNVVLKKHLKEKFNIDLSEFQKTFNRPSLLHFDDKVASKLYGYKDKADYYYQASSVHRMPSIKIPTVVMQAMDDPIVVPQCIAQDVFDNNPNLALLTSQYGGHTAYYTSILGLKHWFMEPVIKYFKAYCVQPQESARM